MSTRSRNRGRRWRRASAFRVSHCAGVPPLIVFAAESQRRRGAPKRSLPAGAEGTRPRSRGREEQASGFEPRPAAGGFFFFFFPEKIDRCPLTRPGQQAWSRGFICKTAAPRKCSEGEETRSAGILRRVERTVPGSVKSRRAVGRRAEHGLGRGAGAARGHGRPSASLRACACVEKRRGRRASVLVSTETRGAGKTLKRDRCRRPGALVPARRLPSGVPAPASRGSEAWEGKRRGPCQFLPFQCPWGLSYCCWRLSLRFFCLTTPVSGPLRNNAVGLAACPPPPPRRP